jgi:hypothetical protein
MRDQPDTPTVTVQCDLGLCHRCKGRIISATEAHDAPCGHDCHRPAQEGPAPLVVLGYLCLAAAILQVPGSPHPDRREVAQQPRPPRIETPWSG